MSATVPISERVEQLKGYINDGRILEAMDEFYDQSLVMRENSEAPTEGLSANIEREKQFLDSVKDVYYTHLLANETVLDYVFCVRL